MGGRSHMGEGPVGFTAVLGIDRVMAREGRSEVRLPITADLLNPLGVVHGGVIAALVDEAIGLAAYSLLPPGAAAVTAELHVHFLMPARSGLLVARGTIWRSGRRLITGEAVVEAVAHPPEAAGPGQAHGTAAHPDGRAADPGPPPHGVVVARADGTWAVITPAVPLP